VTEDRRSDQLTRSEVLAIYHAKGSLLQIGIEHGVSPAHAGGIKRGLYHGEITGQLQVLPSMRRVLTDAEKAALTAPGTHVEAARAVGCSRETAKRYRRMARERSAK